MRFFRTTLLFALALAFATRTFAQENLDSKVCAQLLPAIERLERMLVQEAKARTAQSDTQRMQVVMTLLGLRYHNIESLESSLRSYESEEDDLRGAMAREQAQLESIEEAARTATTPVPDAERKAQRAEFEAVLKGLEEKAKGLRERKSTAQGQLAVERHDLEKLEALVRTWLEKTD